MRAGRCWSNESGCLPRRPPAGGGVIEALAFAWSSPLPAYDRISIGFPGVVRDGKVAHGAPNLGHRACGPASTSRGRWSRPPRQADADRQRRRPAGAGRREGVGAWSWWSRWGRVSARRSTWDGTSGAPISRWRTTPFRKGQTYEEQLGNAARKRLGNKEVDPPSRARDRVRSARWTHFDHLYIGGGNAWKLRIRPRSGRHPRLLTRPGFVAASLCGAPEPSEPTPARGGPERDRPGARTPQAGYLSFAKSPSGSAMIEWP